jgi:hypothetical protein
MIPAFNSKTGLLPPGIHQATWDEFVTTFGYNKHRQRLIEGLYTASKILQKYGCLSIYIDGSFVTEKTLPGDIDVCWDIAGMNITLLQREQRIFFDPTPGRQIQKKAFGCEFFQANWMETGSQKPFLEFMQQHYGVPKGILQVQIFDL